MITPVDLETTVFRRGLRGYKISEVQEFMASLSRDYEFLYRENRDLKEKVEELTAKLNQYELVEQTLRNTMVLAQETAEEVKNSARQQGVLIIREAEQQAEQIKQRLKEETQAEVQTLTNLKTQVDYFRTQFKSFLNGLIEMADRQLDMNIVWEYLQKNNSNLAEYTKEAAAAEGPHHQAQNETQPIKSE